MPYTAYKTWTVGEILTAANMNSQVRDNGLLGPEALATADGEVWIATGANAGEMVAVMDASNRLKLLYGGIEADISAITTDGILRGTGAGTMGILANFSTVAQAEAEAGTATTDRRWTAQRVKQAIDALSGASLAKVMAYSAGSLGIEVIA